VCVAQQCLIICIYTSFSVAGLAERALVFLLDAELEPVLVAVRDVEAAPARVLLVDVVDVFTERDLDAADGALLLAGRLAERAREVPERALETVRALEAPRALELVRALETVRPRALLAVVFFTERDLDATGAFLTARPLHNR